MIEGQYLSKQDEPVKVNIIGSFKTGQDEQADQVRRLLDGNKVMLYTVDETEYLIKVTAETVHR